MVEDLALSTQALNQLKLVKNIEDKGNLDAIIALFPKEMMDNVRPYTKQS